MLIIRNASTFAGHRIDVACRAGSIVAFNAHARDSAAEVIDAEGGLLLPGLADHHLHLRAMAAAAASVQCGPPAVTDETALAHALQEAHQAETNSSDWIRGIGYHESVAGVLDRRALDRLGPDRAVRVQHRSGRMWFLNTVALLRLGLLHGNEMLPSGVGRGDDDLPDGTFFRCDEWLRQRIARTEPVAPPNLARVSRTLAAQGITSITDASPDNDANVLAYFEAALQRGEFSQRLRLMGRLSLPISAHSRITRDAVKLVIDDAALPDIDDFAAQITDAHAHGRTVAIHCVTRIEIVFALAAFDVAGCVAGDRIEHAGVCPNPELAKIERLGLTVTTQPALIYERGDQWRVDVDADDQPFLWRLGTLLVAGIPVLGGSDAPHGPIDPWLAMRTATNRRTRAAQVLDDRECITAEQALSLFTNAHQPWVEGTPADLCLLDRPWSEARVRLDARDVRATIIAGDVVYRRA